MTLDLVSRVCKPAHRLSLVLFLVLAATLPAWAVEDVEYEQPGERIEFESEDGVQLVGWLLGPSKGAAKGHVLLVHGPRRSSRDYRNLAKLLSKKGFATFRFDLRGHGESLMQGDEELDRELFGPEEFAAMALDVQAAFEVAADAAGDEPVHLVGSDVGSSLVFLHAQGNDRVASVAMLSPGLGYEGINIYTELKDVGPWPLLLVFSTEDGYSRTSVDRLQPKLVMTEAPLHVEQYYGVGHGTKMLAREPNLEPFMLAWLSGTVITKEGRALDDAGKPIAEGKEAVESELDSEAERRRLEQEAAKERQRTATKGVGDETDNPVRRYQVEESKPRKDR